MIIYVVINIQQVVMSNGWNHSWSRITVILPADGVSADHYDSGGQSLWLSYWHHKQPVLLSGSRCQLQYTVLISCKLTVRSDDLSMILSIDPYGYYRSVRKLSIHEMIISIRTEIISSIISSRAKLSIRIRIRTTAKPILGIVAIEPIQWNLTKRH